MARSRAFPDCRFSSPDPEISDPTDYLVPMSKTEPNAAEESKKDEPVPSKGGPKQKPGEVGGPKGPEPTRYGDWEVGGRCTDF